MGPYTSLRSICKAMGSRGEARPIVGLFKCSWLNLGASLAGSCRVRTGGFSVSMRFIRCKEVGIIAVSRTPGPSLVGIFAAGLPCLMLLSLPRVEEKGQKAVGMVAHRGRGSPQDPLLIWVSLAFFTFFPALGICCHPGYHDPTCFLYAEL
jgi:hypothetical protein